MTRYLVVLDEWWLVIDADSEEEARQKGATELKAKIRPQYLHAWEDPHAHYVVAQPPVEPGT